MSRSNYDKPFYVDVGTSVVAIRCASNHDVLMEYRHVPHSYTLELAKKVCDRMNEEAEIGRPLRNCDVGDAEEQLKRFLNFCRIVSTNETCDGCILLPKCPTLEHCVIAWEQMPYKEGGAS